jgi:predicted O-methyltransferase YrrM
MFKEMELYVEPRKQCLSQYVWPKEEPEMTEFESAFLCGLIKQKRPRKIVEVGIAAGGTTAIVLKCLELLGLEKECEMYSVDLSEQFYRGKRHRSGYLADELLNNGKTTFNHKFMLGKLLPEFLDEIGPDIDFVILDTMHSMPGESLDFLAVYPYLKAGACVVLHDVALNHYFPDCVQLFATQILFSSVTADKYLVADDSRPLKYPNIAAFDINDETGAHLTDIVNSLMVTWKYLPDSSQLKLYFNHYQRHYGEEISSLFSTVYALQQETAKEIERERRKSQMTLKNFLVHKWDLFCWQLKQKFQ